MRRKAGMICGEVCVKLTRAHLEGEGEFIVQKQKNKAVNTEGYWNSWFSNIVIFPQ